jgi:hypothetical protein
MQESRTPDGRKPSVQEGRDGSTPIRPLQLQKTPHVRLLTQTEVNDMLERWHYLGPLHVIQFAMGHEEGCCVFSVPRSKNLTIKEPKTIELVRMVGKPGHTWAMSSLMSHAVKECLRRGYTKVITYADPQAGHNGNTYKAAGWTEDGFSPADTIYLLDGKRVSRKNFYDKHGTQSRQKMKEIYGDRLTFKPCPPKKRFVKLLQQGGTMNAADKNAAQAATPKRKRRTKAQIAAEQAADNSPEISADPADNDVGSDTAVLKAAEALPQLKYPNLHAALIAAQASIKSIARDANHPKFGAYTSSENMIATGRVVFNKHGLEVVFIGDKVERLGDEMFIKTNRYLVGHESGQTLEGSMTVPVEKIGEKGTWQDAVLKSDTIANSYYIRGVLQLPRADDNKHKVADQPQAHFATPQPLAPATVVSGQPSVSGGSGGESTAPWKMSEAEFDTIKVKIAATKASESGILKRYGVASLALLSKQHYDELVGILNLRSSANKAAGHFNGKVTSVTPHQPAPTAPEATPAAKPAGVQLLNEQQVLLITRSLSAKKKDEHALLAEFAFASLAEIPVDDLSKVMLWIRS